MSSGGRWGSVGHEGPCLVGADAEIASIVIPTLEPIDGVAFLDDGATLVTGSRGGVLGAWNTGDLAPLWSVDVGPGLGQIGVRDGLIWFGSQQDLAVSDQAATYRLLAMPHNQASFVAAARSSTDAELTAAECIEFFGSPCG